jgi:hypothetical protein
VGRSHGTEADSGSAGQHGPISETGEWNGATGHDRLRKHLIAYNEGPMGDTRFPYVFSRSEVRRAVNFEFRIGWQLKDFRIDSITQTSEDEYLAIMVPRFRLIRKCAPLVLKRSEVMGFDCFVRVIERCCVTIMRSLVADPEKDIPVLANFDTRCRKPINVNARLRLPVRMQLKKHRAGERQNTFIMDFSAGEDGQFHGCIHAMMMHGQPTSGDD